MKQLEDGSLQFEENEFIPNMSQWKPNTKIPLNFVPDFVECKERELLAKCLPCGRNYVIWRCKHFDVTVNPLHCRLCSYEQKQ